MAEAVVSDLLQVVFEKPASPILERYGLLSVVREEMESLRSTLSMIQAEDAEERRVKDKALRNWLGKLKDSAYDADEILDEFTAESLRRQVEIRGRVTNKVFGLYGLRGTIDVSEIVKGRCWRFSVGQNLMRWNGC
ncbi:putative disease resistance protein RGA4 isoform X2 [Magnolia sinica]|uniref:putative disease resistance protein RGA4 isoform X2 n=1 Tax=Magnolia sinica TaxID=86752 RepID=UPI002659F83B|nr:putative disease resistance protein RGA4 isoform X2 [Magnolia sinica]